jgi:hypothetical protein
MDSNTLSSLYFALSMSAIFVIVGIILSIRRKRPHPLLLVCFLGLSISWIEAPYDWAMYAQFPPDLPRMPSWWPLNWTYGGGVPNSVPVGYMSYFAMPALLAAWLASRMSAILKWRRPQTLLTVGLVVGFVYALIFNGFVGAKSGVFRYGRVIEGLAIRPGTVEQYPLYDALAMGIQVMVVAYLLARTDSLGRTIIDAWADSKAKTRLGSAMVTLLGFALVGNIVYLSVFAPHYVTKVMHLQTVAPDEQLFPSIPNQPL